MQEMDCNFIDHEYTDHIVCPYCGHEDIDSWEIQPSEEDLGLIECCACGKHFYAQRIITIEYSTEKAKYGTCKHCGGSDVPIEDYHSCIGEYKDLCPKCGYKEKRKLEIEYCEKLSRKTRMEGGHE